MHIVGLMSGTSLDGISAAVVRFEARGEDAAARGDTGASGMAAAPRATLLTCTHRGYTADERARLETAMRGASAQEYCRLHADLGTWFAEAALSAIAKSGVPRSRIAAIASHGQTLWHEPGHSTWQLGDAARIAERIGCAVISDFRVRDVAAGGQGAPLVPIADLLLFAHETHPRALQNLGGIGNVTIVPPIGGAASDPRDGRANTRAFDTGPGVVLIDAMTRRVRPDLAFDKDGALASAGTPIDAIVDAALTNEYFLRPPPKSTGREVFSREYADAFLHACRVHEASDADVVATAVAFTARSIADQYRRWIHEPIGDVVLSGGGARNPELVRRITHALSVALPGVPVRLFSELFFDGDAKEAVAFALLGYLHLAGQPGNVPMATGAKGPRVLGALTPGAS